MYNWADELISDYMAPPRGRKGEFYGLNHVHESHIKISYSFYWNSNFIIYLSSENPSAFGFDTLEK